MANVDLFDVPDTVEYGVAEQPMGYDSDAARLPLLAGLGVGRDTVLPSITNLSPAALSSIARADTISFDVTDVTGFARIVVEAERGSGNVEVIHDGTGFCDPFTGTRTPIANGFTYSFERSGFGWPEASLTLRVLAIDADGNQSSPTDFSYTVTDPLNPYEVVWYFKMQAEDAGAAPPGFVYWIAVGAADEAGAGYSGASPTPIGAMVLGSVRVLARWQG